MANNDKLVGVISYITIIGWIIAVLLRSKTKSSIGHYHVRQALMVHIGFLLAVIVRGPVGVIINIICVVLAIIGIVYAFKKQKKALPVIGEPAQKLFASL